LLASFITDYNKDVYTFFAPTDTAISITSETDAMYNNGSLAQLLGAHFVLEGYSSSMFANELVKQTMFTSQFSTQGDQWIRTNKYGANWYASGNKISSFNNSAPNTAAIVHFVDSLIMPLTAANNNTITQFVQGSTETTYLTYLNQANLASLFDDRTFSVAFTVFIPTNAAFSALSPANIEALSNATIASQLIKYHVINGSKFPAAFPITATSLNGQSLTISVQGNLIKIGNATVVSFDQYRSGIAYLIDTVLIPADVQAYFTSYVPTSTSGTGASTSSPSTAGSTASTSTSASTSASSAASSSAGSAASTTGSSGTSLVISFCAVLLAVIVCLM